MANFKNQVEQILSERQRNLPAIEKDEQTVKDLRSKLDTILAATKNDTSLSSLTTEIEDTQKKLKEVFGKIENTKLRFTRNSLNIGVSGQARVGKSTLLQTLTGLNDNQLPTGHGNPVTAVRSCIHNIAGNSYADIDFYTEEEFVLNRIKPLSKFIGTEIRSVNDFKSVNLDNLDSSFESSDLASRLKEMKESINDFEDLLGKSTLKLTDLDELVNYVAYRNDANKDSYKMYYPAVKNINIYCSFPNLDDVKLQFVDLPGFGELGAVDEIQLSGLENDVDHFMLITMPTHGTISGGQNYAKIEQVLAGIQKSVTNRSELESFVINLNNTEINNVETLVGSWEETLKKDPNVSDNNKYKVDVKGDKAAVDQMFANILARMTEALPLMDKQFLNSYRTNLGLSELREKLEYLQNKVFNWIKNAPAELSVIDDERAKLRNELSKELKSMAEELIKREGNSSDLGNLVSTICKDIKSSIEKNMMLDDSKKWEDYVYNPNGVTGNYHPECHRLRISILDTYESLNNYYESQLETLKKGIISIISRNTKGLISEGLEGSAAISDVLTTLNTCDDTVPTIKKAFDWLNQVHLDFRSQVYPSIFSTSEMASLNPDKTSIPTTASLEFMKDQLSLNARSYAQAIKDKILERDTCTAFLQCTLEHFSDCLIRSDEKTLNKEFGLLVQQFGISEKSDDKRHYQNLRNEIKDAINLINDLEDK